MPIIRFVTQPRALEDVPRYVLQEEGDEAASTLVARRSTLVAENEQNLPLASPSSDVLEIRKVRWGFGVKIKILEDRLTYK